MSWLCKEIAPPDDTLIIEGISLRGDTLERFDILIRNDGLLLVNASTFSFLRAQVVEVINKFHAGLKDAGLDTELTIAETDSLIHVDRYTHLEIASLTNTFTAGNVSLNICPYRDPYVIPTIKFTLSSESYYPVRIRPDDFFEIVRKLSTERSCPDTPFSYLDDLIAHGIPKRI